MDYITTTMDYIITITDYIIIIITTELVSLATVDHYLGLAGIEGDEGD